MASMALERWHRRRAQRMDGLLDVHEQVRNARGGPGIGADQIQLALIRLLTSEFQGFARDLHDEGIAVVHDQMAGWNPVWAGVVEQLLRNGRDLDRRNASPSALASDFDRFGLNLWPDLIRRDGRHARWHGSLERLNLARNAIAHDDVGKFRRLHGDGVALDLHAFHAWRRAAEAVAGGSTACSPSTWRRRCVPGYRGDREVRRW